MLFSRIVLIVAIICTPYLESYKIGVVVQGKIQLLK